LRCSAEMQKGKGRRTALKAALSGSNPNAPGSAGGYLLDKLAAAESIVEGAANERFLAAAAKLIGWQP
jgi:hypothetical protein